MRIRIESVHFPHQSMKSPHWIHLLTQILDSIKAEKKSISILHKFTFLYFILQLCYLDIPSKCRKIYIVECNIRLLMGVMGKPLIFDCF